MQSSIVQLLSTSFEHTLNLTNILTNLPACFDLLNVGHLLQKVLANNSELLPLPAHIAHSNVTDVRSYVKRRRGQMTGEIIEVIH
jgi:hypothetical protein